MVQAEHSLSANEKRPQGIKRSDPDPRPVEGATNRVDVEGKDPNKHYVYVSNVNDPTLNPGSYLAMGYQFTQYDKDGAQPVLGYRQLEQGDKIENFGCVLMECTLEQKAKIDRDGVPGMGLGQAWADKVVNRIRKGDILDDTEPMTKAEMAARRGIRTTRYANDDRENWGF